MLLGKYKGIWIWGAGIAQSEHQRVYGAGRPRSRGSIPYLCKIFMLSPQRPDRLLASTHPPILWVPGAVSPGVKRQERETDRSPPSSGGWV
jgi:hypothetical protein